MVVHGEHLEVALPCELLGDPRVTFPADLTLVEIGLAGVRSHDAHVPDVLDPLPRPDQLLERAGLSRTSGEVVSVMIGLGLAGAVMGSFRIGGVVWPLLIGMAAGSLPLVYLSYRASKRLQAFQKEFPDAIDMMTRAIRAGHALSGAVRLVGEETQLDISGDVNLHDEMGEVPMHAIVPRLGGTPGVLRLPAPGVGQHNDEIYGRIGYAPERLRMLRERKVI